MKKNTRIKITLPHIDTREDAEFVMSELARAVNAQRKLIAQRDAAVLTINDRFADPLAKIEEDIASHTAGLRSWAESNPDAFPKDRKSLALSAGTIGFRTGTPKVALLSRAWNWAKVLSNLRSFLPSYVRAKEEIDKDKIIQDRATFPLAPNGLKIVQEETFFADPLLTPTEARQTETL